MPSQLKILFIDDHVGLRDAIINTLKQNNPDMTIKGASNKEDALEFLKKNMDVCSIILDLNLNDTNGLELLPEIRKINKGVSVLVYSMYNDPIHIEQALKADVQGYVCKSATMEELNQAIKTVSSGELYYNKQAKGIMKILLSGNGDSRFSGQAQNQMEQVYEAYQTLTQKEKDVFYYLSLKKSTQEIAQILSKSEKTVINQKSIIYSKLNIQDRLELLEKAKILGLIFN